MTINNQPIRQEKLGNGVATKFSFDFIITKSTDLVVVKIASDGIKTNLLRGTGDNSYILDITTYPSRGEITYPASGTENILQTGDRIVLYSNLVFSQETIFTSLILNPVEPALDYLTLLSLRLQDEASRSIKFPITSFHGEVSLPDQLIPDSLLKVSSDGTKLENSITIGDINDIDSSVIEARAYALQAKSSSESATSSSTSAGVSEQRSSVFSQSAINAYNEVLEQIGVGQTILSEVKQIETRVDADKTAVGTLVISANAVLTSVETKGAIIITTVTAIQTAVGTKASQVSTDAATVAATSTTLTSKIAIINTEIAKLSSNIAKTQTNADDSATSATAAAVSSTAASGASSSALTYASQAKISANSSDASQKAAAGYEASSKTYSETSDTKAILAGTYATSSQTYSTGAMNYASSAETFSTSSKTYRDMASASASSASSDSATIASKITSATSLVTAAQGYATAAAGSSTSASSKATEAKSSSVAAKSSADDSKISQTAAKTSETAAETSSTVSTDNKEKSGNSADDAAISATEANRYAQEAEDAANRANSSAGDVTVINEEITIIENELVVIEDDLVVIKENLVNFRGNWVANTPYAKNDLVNWADGNFIALLDSFNLPPVDLSVTPSRLNYPQWRPMVDSGVQEIYLGTGLTPVVPQRTNQDFIKINAIQHVQTDSDISVTRNYKVAQWNSSGNLIKGLGNSSKLNTGTTQGTVPLIGAGDIIEGLGNASKFNTGTTQGTVPLVGAGDIIEGLGNASKFNTGTTQGTVPLIGAGDIIEGLGNASKFNTGTTQGTVPLIGAGDIIEGLGNASKFNTGTTQGTVPLIGDDNYLSVNIIPNSSLRTYRSSYFTRYSGVIIDSRPAINIKFYDGTNVFKIQPPRPSGQYTKLDIDIRMPCYLSKSDKDAHSKVLLIVFFMTLLEDDGEGVIKNYFRLIGPMYLLTFVENIYYLVFRSLVVVDNVPNIDNWTGKFSMHFANYNEGTDKIATTVNPRDSDIAGIGWHSSIVTITETL